MRFQIVRIGKCCLAEITFVRFHTIVNIHVRLIRGSSGETLDRIAKKADVSFVLGFGVVSLVVSPQIALSYQHATLFTRLLS